MIWRKEMLSKSKSNFYKANDQLVVNLDHVSSISFDEKNSRIIFNLDYSVQLDINEEGSRYKKTISDYIYFNSDNFEKDASKLTEFLGDSSFIRKPSDLNKKFASLINLDKVSSIKLDDERLRIILNMTNSVSFKGNNGYKLTGEFIYCDFNNPDDYNSAVNSLF